MQGLVTKREVLFDLYPAYYDLADGNNGKLLCYCDSLQFSANQTDDHNVFTDTFINMTKVALNKNLNETLIKSKQLTYPDTNSFDDKFYQAYFGGVGLKDPKTGEIGNYGDKLCQDWFWSTYKGRALKYGSLFVIIGINLVLKTLIKYFVDFERHNSRSNEDASLQLKLFIAQLFNTAMLVLIVNWNLDTFDSQGYWDIGALANYFPIFTGDYGDFGTDWYLNIGSQFIVTMVLFIFQVMCASTYSGLSI
jgi:hypothetical protein